MSSPAHIWKSLVPLSGKRARGPVGEIGVIDIHSVDPCPFPELFLIVEGEEYGPYDVRDLEVIN